MREITTIDQAIKALEDAESDVKADFGDAWEEAMPDVIWNLADQSVGEARAFFERQM